VTHKLIWNLVIPDIEGYNIEVFDNEGLYDIEYNTYDIDITSFDIEVARKNLDIEETSLSTSQTSK
jgi:hypothetical protein